MSRRDYSGSNSAEALVPDEGRAVRLRLRGFGFACLANRSRERGERLAKFGGESGIRTLPPPLESVSYRIHDATVAVDASDAVAPCPPLPALTAPNVTSGKSAEPS